MKANYLLILLFTLFRSVSEQPPQTFVGSTPEHSVVRSFLGIPVTEPIDFIRWKLVIKSDSYELTCRYGMSKGGTPGFINEKLVSCRGKLDKKGDIFILHEGKKILELVKVNENLVHLLDHSHQMLVGNGGYSFVLSNDKPIATDYFTITPKKNTKAYPLVFEGRTPCQELSQLLKLNKGEICPKLKWYFVLYADTLTSKPSYYLSGGMGYRKETMERGKWRIKTLDNGRIIYQLSPDNGAYTLNLLKGDDNILFFMRPDGSLLVGNEDFGYTLNRRKKEYEPIKK